jgi:serine/threonine protein kinase
MKYPLRGEYDTAVRNLDKFVFDNILKYGKPVMQANNPHLLRSYNGGKAIVYEIQTNPKKFALKCWVEDLGDLKIRYKAIDGYLKQIKLPYFVDFSYNEQGILVNGQKFPTIRMEWVNGIGFKTFISNNINNSICIRDFADKFLTMVGSLHKNAISHGDLQHGNIMVRNNGDICLIDYDSLYIPSLSNEEDRIKGLDGYQHPNRSKIVKLSPKSDYFSELVIYLSLLVISEKPNFWKSIEKEERLLFSKADLVNPRSSSIFAKLTQAAQFSPEVIYFTLELEKFCRQSDIHSLQPLEDLVNAYGGSKVSWDFSSIKPNLSAPTPTPVSTNANSSTWDVVVKPTSKPSVKVTASDPWSKLETSSSNAWDKLDNVQPSGKDTWDKLDNVQPSGKDTWDKLYKPLAPEPTRPVVDDNIWNKFDRIWNKFLKSVSSIWNKFSRWFN